MTKKSTPIASAYERTVQAVVTLAGEHGLPNRFSANEIAQLAGLHAITVGHLFAHYNIRFRYDLGKRRIDFRGYAQHEGDDRKYATADWLPVVDE